MQKFFWTFLLSLATAAAHAQLSLVPNQTAAQLAATLVATQGNLGVVISNPILTCDSNANAVLTGTSNFGINNGIVLSSGFANTDMNQINVGLNGLPGELGSSALSAPGDAMLDSIVTPYLTYDACVLEFDIQPVGNFMEFEYVFGSEEYPEFNCSAFNDVFGFYISGPGFAAPTNIALLPNSVIPVSINSINDGTGGCSNNQNLYVTNIDTTNTMDGFTTPLVSHVVVTPGSTYHLKFAVADVADMIYNSYVILKANSLKSGNNIPAELSAQQQEDALSIYPTEIQNTMYIDNRSAQHWDIEIIGFDGTAVDSKEISYKRSVTALDLSHLSKGLYLIKMTGQTDKRIYTSKIIKY